MLCIAENTRQVFRSRASNIKAKNFTMYTLSLFSNWVTLQVMCMAQLEFELNIYCVPRMQNGTFQNNSNSTKSCFLLPFTLRSQQNQKEPDKTWSLFILIYRGLTWDCKTRGHAGTIVHSLYIHVRQKSRAPSWRLHWFSGGRRRTSENHDLFKSHLNSMERNRRRKTSQEFSEILQHVHVEIGEESLLSISNVSDLSGELALDNCTVLERSALSDEGIDCKSTDICSKDTVDSTFSHVDVRFEDTDSDVLEPSQRKDLSAVTFGRKRRHFDSETQKVNGKLIM